jgi:hypothetical protein
MKFARLNLVVVLMLLAAFLFVQADLPISQARETGMTMTGDKCMMQCCCAPEKHAQGTCCCSSKRSEQKSGCLLRSSHCGDDGQGSGMPIVVRFQVTLPVLRFAGACGFVQKPILSFIAEPNTRDTEPPVPPPRLLVPA